MEPMLLIVALFVLALALVKAEMHVPSHGLLAVAAFFAAFAAVGVGFAQGRVLGTSLLVGTVVATPFAIAMFLRLWAASPIGRRLTLNSGTTASPEHEPICVGDLGTTASTLRPMGEADFGPVSVQVVGHHGRAIASGVRVRVVSYENGVATVEPAELV